VDLAHIGRIAKSGKQFSVLSSQFSVLSSQFSVLSGQLSGVFAVPSTLSP
jgi:hypothetical protein